jgi:uncharacterized protein (TIGR02147 family)
MIPVQDYTDYRLFIKDWLDEMRTTNPIWSWRLLSQRTGIDHGMLVNIVQGNRHLAVKGISKLCEGMHLNPEESKYFEAMVYYARAKTADETRVYFNQMWEMRKVSLHRIGIDGADYLQSWKNVALRALLSFADTDQPERLGKWLLPSLTKEEVNESLELLKNLKMIESFHEGKWKLSNPLLTSGGDWNSAAVRTFQQEILKLGQDAISTVPKEERDISTLTLSIPNSAIPILKERIAEFRGQIIKILDDLGNADRVVQLNIQLFPLSHARSKGYV